MNFRVLFQLILTEMIKIFCIVNFICLNSMNINISLIFYYLILVIYVLTNLKSQFKIIVFQLVNIFFNALCHFTIKPENYLEFKDFKIR